MKIAIIGCGSIGQRHARNLRKFGMTQLLLMDPQIERADLLSQELNAMCFESVPRTFEERPEVAVICAPTSRHLELASEALEHNCHVFIEKPISGSTEGVYSLIEAAEARERVLFVGHNFRFDPILRCTRAWLTEGKIGSSTSARFHFGSYLPWRHPWEDYRSGYGARRELGGGVILDAIHEFDMALWLFGEPEAIYCTGGNFSDLEIDVEDTAEVLMSYADKVVSIHLDFVERPAERRCEIIGTQGQIEADFFARYARYFDGGERRWHQAVNCESIDETYESEMRHFLDCIAGRAKPVVDGHAAVKSLLVAERAKESMRTRAPVTMDNCVLTAGVR